MLLEIRWVGSKSKILLLMGTVVALTWAMVQFVFLPLRAKGAPPLVLILAAAVGATLLTVGAAWLIVGYLKRMPEYTRALQSRVTLEIAAHTLPFLRTGFSAESAQEAARSILERTGAAAVAITDKTTALAFVGIGEDHHLAPGPVMTDGTKNVLREGKVQVLRNRDEIGCPMEGCPLQSAIVVPFKIRGNVVGTLKIYYQHPHRFTQEVMETAEGLAALLSTQLELARIHELERSSWAAEIRASQAQINPHFLFNCLTTIASLCRTDAAKARSLLILFADFFRKTLEWDDLLVTLDQEMDFVNSYLILEKARFEDLLSVEIDIHPATRKLCIPPLTIQPIVENAIMHGRREAAPLRVCVRTYLSENAWEVVVEDDGGGIPEADLPRVLEPGFGKGLGVGLSNLDKRFRTLMGRDYRCEIGASAGGGTRVVLHLPLEGRISLAAGR
ncbi:MAG: histidine kinase [Pseudomonadota bacterium]